MKKLLSVFLAMSMVFTSAVTVFAGNQTLVRYVGEAIEEWNLVVPEAMAPGDTEDVSLSGTWDTDTTIIVSTPEEVVLTNTLKPSETKTLAVTFDGFNLVGNNTESVSALESISVANISGALFGTWEGVIVYNLTSKNEFLSTELKQDEAGNYLIETPGDLYLFADKVNNSIWGEHLYKSVILTANIDLQNRPFTPIGTTQTPGTNGNSMTIDRFYYGVFDGQGHTIYNLNVTATDSDTNNNAVAALFGAVVGSTEKTVIKNLKVDGAKITSTHFAGVIAGTSENSAEILDCEVRNATVTSTYYNEENSGDKAGAIIGVLNSNVIVSGCHAEDCTVTASRDAGQLVGCAKESSVINSTATNVTVEWNNLGTGENIRNELIGRLR